MPAMRSLPLILLGLLAAGGAHAQAPPETGSRAFAPVLADCVPPREVQDVVETSGVVAPAAAVMTARRQVPNADVVRANLCRSDNALVYVIVALRKDGRVVHVMIDGSSGRVRSVQ
jgi:uncharacterized membrane protein YkoI